MCNAYRVFTEIEKAIKVKKGFFRKKEVTTGYETVLTRSSIEQMIAEEAQAKFGMIVKKYINKFVNAPIRNHIGRQWVRHQMHMKKLGIK